MAGQVLVDLFARLPRLHRIHAVEAVPSGDVFVDPVFELLVRRLQALDQVLDLKNVDIAVVGIGVNEQRCL